jgi:anthranilate phosphoribosyltransferase
VFARRGDSALVMRGEDGLDEFSTAAPTRLWLVQDRKVTEITVDAADLGVPRSEPGDLRGGDAAFNGAAARRVFAGEAGPVRDSVVLNAAAAFAAQAGFPGGLEAALRAGMARATETLDAGAVPGLLERWVATATAARAAE